MEIYKSPVKILFMGMAGPDLSELAFILHINSLRFWYLNGKFL